MQKTSVKTGLIILLLCGLSLHVGAQKEWQLALHATGEPLPEFVDYKKKFNDQKQRQSELTNVLSDLYQSGFLSASVDSIQDSGKLLTAFVHVGQQYKWARLSKGNVDEGILSEIGFRDKLYNNKALSPAALQKLYSKLIAHYENRGYPFATVRLDSIEFQDNTLSGALHLEKNMLLTIDSIIMKGEAKIAPIYIYNYLGIKAGMLYNETTIKQVSTRLKELPFIREVRPGEVVFTPKKADLYLYLEGKKASQFNGILGVLPDDETGKITLTGDAKLKLKNALKRGELIDFNWRKLQTNTQDLKIQFNYPFVFNSPFGIDLNFKLYKRDTTFLELNRDVGLQYLLSGGNYYQIFLHSQTSNLLSTSTLLLSSTLPPFADVSTNTYGFGLKQEQLDYRLNPRRGFSVTFNGGVGSKVIRKNPDLEEANPNIYDGVDLKSTQYHADFIGDVFLPLGNRSTVNVGLNAAYMFNENLFINEMYRIGGIKTLRGFDEESITASSYYIGTLEYRFLLEQNSNLYLFVDGAYYENRSVETLITDTPIGFGTGISFETKAGIFSINYALGKQFDNPILFRAAKIHFGFVNFF